MESIGKQYQAAREAAGLTRRELAARMMIPVYHLEAIEEKNFQMSLTLELMLQKELGVEHDYSLGGEVPQLKKVEAPCTKVYAAPMGKMEAFCLEHAALAGLYEAKEDQMQGTGALGYGVEPESEAQLNSYMETLPEDYRSRLYDLIYNMLGDNEKIYYIYGAMDGVRLALEGYREGVDRSILNAVAALQGQKAGAK